MEFLKRFRLVIIIVLPILILVLIRSFSGNHFRPDAKKMAESSLDGSNIISINQIESLGGEKLIVLLDSINAGLDDTGISQIKIPSELVLQKDYSDIFRKHVGPILLWSSEPALTAKIWMLLAQMGISDIYILSKDPDSEDLKYKFRPDSLVRPEM